MKTNKKIAIITSSFNSNITVNLYDGAINTLISNDVPSENIKSIWVPGALEIPVILEKYKKNFSGFIIFGCVIRGATSHYDLVVNVTSSSIYKIVNKDKLPLAFSLLTVENYQQAIERSSLEKKI